MGSIRQVLPLYEKHGIPLVVEGLPECLSEPAKPGTAALVSSDRAVSSAFPNTAFRTGFRLTVLKSETPAAYTSHVVTG